MKVKKGVLDLGFFIDRTIKQCLEYDLDVSDTDAVLEDMAKAWPPEDGAGQRSKKEERRGCLDDGVMDSPVKINKKLNSKASNKSFGAAYNVNNNNSSINSIITSTNNNSSVISTSYSTSVSNDIRRSAGTLSKVQVPNTRLGRVSEAVSAVCRPGLLSIPYHRRGSSLDEDTAGCARPKQLGDRETGLIACDTKDQGQRDGDLRRSHSVEELMSLELPVKRDLEGCHPGPSPGTTSPSATARPDKLKSRLQLRYLWDKDGEVPHLGGRFLETMDTRFTTYSTNGSASLNDSEINVELESPEQTSRYHKDLSMNSTIRSERDRKRPGDVGHENEVALPKKPRQGYPVDFSRPHHHHYHHHHHQHQQQQQQTLPQSNSPQQTPGPHLHLSDRPLRPEGARYPPLARLSSNEALIPGATLTELIQRGMDPVRVSTALPNSQGANPSSNQVVAFLPTTPSYGNNTVSIDPREMLSLETNHIIKYSPHHQQQAHHPKHVSDSHQQQLLDKILYQNSVEQQQQYRHQRLHNHHQPRYLHQKQYSHQERASGRGDSQEVNKHHKSRSALRNPMYRIASIIAEELQKDDENCCDENQLISRRTYDDARKMCNKRCTNLHCGTQSRVDTRSSLKANLAPGQDGVPKYHPNGVTSRVAIESRKDQIRGMEIHRQSHRRPVYRAEMEAHPARHQFRNRPHRLENSQQQKFTLERPSSIAMRALQCDEATRLPYSLPRTHPLVSTRPHHEDLTQNLHSMRENYGRVVETNPQSSLDVSVSARHALLYTSSRMPVPHQPTVEMSSQAPPPSHQPLLNHAHVTPPSDNVLLPSHHPMSLLSPTRVPVYSAEVSNEDQPQDLSNKGRSSADTPTIDSNHITKDAFQNDHVNGKDAPSLSNAHDHGRTMNLTMSLKSSMTSSPAREEFPLEFTSSMKLGEDRPLNLAIKDRLKRGFYSTPSSPELGEEEQEEVEEQDQEQQNKNYKKKNNNNNNDDDDDDDDDDEEEEEQQQQDDDDDDDDDDDEQQQNKKNKKSNNNNTSIRRKRNLTPECLGLRPLYFWTDVHVPWGRLALYLGPEEKNNS
ncbi:LOW QUALITY PROTEIN: hypothetical protein ElyMa_005847300 [Elysia marginata]|uniref:Uncharacterized protein n=1 Tax=Elysia marginata TaxID=1093978 RepID=A0AAV4FYL2_9GAST|nr:LOW QUALITY PROTEIN: hypothetical protein ElyMa_005847300 [Elysia marginata]